MRPDTGGLVEPFGLETCVLDASTLDPLHLSPAARQRFGCATDAAAPAADLLAPAEADRFRQQTARLHGPSPLAEVTVACQLSRGDAPPCPVRLRVRLGEYDGRRAYIALVQDAPEQTTDLERLQKVLQGAMLGFWDWDLERDTLSVDARWLEILGYRPGDIEITPQSLPALVHEADTVHVHEALHRLVERGESFNLEFRCLHSRGHTVWVRCSGGVVMRDPVSGSSLRACGTTQDISDEKAAAQEREELIRFFNLSADLMMIGRLDGSLLRANPATLAVTGFTEEELQAMPLQQWVHPDDREMTRSELARQAQSGWSVDFINRCMCKDGSWRWLSWRARFDAGSGLSYAIARDITAARELELKLQRQQDLFRALVENSIDVICHFDRQHRHTYVNPRAERLWPGAQQRFIGRTRRELGFPEERCDAWDEAMERVFRTGQPQFLHYRVTFRNRTAHVDWHAFPATMEDGEVRSVFTVSRDITHYARTEEELRKMQRLQGIGLLAGGIAHDFNNILTSLFANLELIGRALPEHHPALEHLRQAHRAFERATQLTGQLLTFAKGGEPVKQNINLESLIQEVVGFDLSGSRVLLVCEAQPGLRALQADRAQISQVFSNLANNARQAMPDGGRLHITLANRELEAGQLGPLPAGRYLECRVRDEGCGIEPEAIDRIFDPYYSTKAQGTGLGLATVYSIVHRHGGHISVHSTPGTGTQFTLYLPATGDACTAAVGVGASERTSEAEPHASSGRILAMDDEQMIRALYTTFLTDQGYDVDTACDGEEAVRLYRQALANGRPYDCLIVDLTVPGGMGGQEALAAIGQIDPTVRAIVASGYAADPVLAEHRQHGFAGRITKPFRISALSEEVGRVLGAG